MEILCDNLKKTDLKLIKKCFGRKTKVLLDLIKEFDIKTINSLGYTSLDFFTICSSDVYFPKHDLTNKISAFGYGVNELEKSINNYLYLKYGKSFFTGEPKYKTNLHIFQDDICLTMF